MKKENNRFNWCITQPAVIPVSISSTVDMADSAHPVYRMHRPSATVPYAKRLAVARSVRSRLIYVVCGCICFRTVTITIVIPDGLLEDGQRRLDD